MNLTLADSPVMPFRLDFTAWALRRNAANIVDRWDGHAYRRVLVLEGKPAEMTVQQDSSPGSPRLQIQVVGDVPAQKAEPAILASLAQLLGTRIDLGGFYRLADAQPRLKLLAQRFHGLKPPRFLTLFEGLVNGIACQQITLTLGIRLLNRLAENYGPSLEGHAGKVYAFPRPRDLASLEPEALRKLGFSLQKSSAIIELARNIVEKRLDLSELESLSDAEALAQLQALRGVGRWTAEYVLLRGMGRLQIFPGDDVGARNHLREWLELHELAKYQTVMQVVEPWKPYAGLVYFHLLLKRLGEAGYLSLENSRRPI